MYGGYWDVYDSITVDDLRVFLEFNDFDVSSFKEYLSDKFNKILKIPFSSPEQFDSISIALVILGFKRIKKDSGTLKSIVHFLIYHHYMLLYHKVSQDYELFQMRSKIANHLGLNLEEYLSPSS
jgi:hypothetical protein